MTWYHHYGRKLFGRYDYLLKRETAEKWLQINRIIYFMSATSLAYVLLNKKEEQLEIDSLTGKPMIEDHSKVHRKLRNMNVDHATITTFSLSEGFKTEDYHKDKYYQDLELEALERARKA